MNRSLPPTVTEASYTRSVALMGTVVTIQVANQPAKTNSSAECNPAACDPAALDETVERAFEWFREIERRCTRFEETSEVMQLIAQSGKPVPVSAILFEAVQFALAVAEESGGAFDPTVGYAMESRGFNEEYKTRRTIRTELPSEGPGSYRPVSYRDVRLDPERRTITLHRPLILDLGAVAKGLAIDMAAKKLQPLQNFAIDAGGDLYLSGRNSRGELWSVGIRHPRRPNELIDSLRVTDRAVCTSGDYERVAPSTTNGENHILDPRTGESARAAASVTVIAPTAMLADAVGTAAFVLGPTKGIRLCERLGVEALIFTPELQRFSTQGISIAHVS